MHPMFKGWLVLLLGITSLRVHGEPMLQAVLDGDTVIIRDQAQTYRLRLLDIDAPELQQAYGKQAKRSLAALCNGPVTVQPSGKDLYGRTLGHLFCNNTDASQYQIAQGMAWFSSRYSTRAELASLQQQAQQQGRGLWQQANPLPPWVWRKRYGQHYQQRE
ncbi:Endonuclease YncB, thermonuclease family [Methylophilus rhizosphaerae]|uniref:Endonuclease YncB, thermonuclease family n=2 Tax=Methylophilus rhizosphaerae TaxID=492660 RepID=A0A1G9DAT7_9PROT|nr:Endonuclease YncB, thermonuclease family [Methylophilus rhizosphaerae]